MKSHKAFILIEVLLAELLISILSLSTLNLQSYLIKTTHRIYETSLAIVRLSSLLEQFYLINNDENRKELYGQWTKENAVLLPHWQNEYICQEMHCSIKMQIFHPYKEILSLAI